MMPVLDCDDFRILAAPVQHFIPTIGLRIEFTRSKKIVAYSCDTEPCAQVTQLAEGADVLDPRIIRRFARPLVRSSGWRSGTAGRSGNIISNPLSNRAIFLQATRWSKPGNNLKGP